MLKKAKALYYHSEFSTEKIEVLKKILKSSNMKSIPKENDSLFRFSSFLPVGTIVAQSLEVDEDKILCLPVLSSNISLPVKQGEYIWYFSEDATIDEVEIKTKPLTMIRHYWLSRIHGTLLSEDLNFTYKERDATILNKAIQEDSEVAENINLPNFESQNFIESNLKNSQKEMSTQSLYEEGLSKHFSAKATPRYFSKTDDLTLQGSYNTLINFSKTNDKTSHNESPEGSISIIAGRLALQDFNFEDDGDEIIPTVLFRNVTNTGKEEQFVIDDKNFKKIKNSLNQEELFKRPDFYLNYNPMFFDNKESSMSFDEDASVLLVNESIEADNKTYYNTDLIENFHFLHDNINSGQLAFENYEPQTLNNDGVVTSVPTILAKSNNLRFIARKELSSENKILPEGSIRLIKESNSILDYSHINMESNGYIDISGSLIKIGNFLSEYIKHTTEGDDDVDDFAETLLGDSESSPKYNNDVINAMKGKGAGVVLGYDENHSESLVLGQTLKRLLEEILATNIEFVEELKKISTALATHTHNNSMPIVSTIPLIGPSGPIPPGSPIGTGIAPSLLPTDPSAYTTYQSNGSTDLKSKYTEINKKLVDILSKFAKTT